MANTRTQRRENELPYIPFGPFQIRLPFIHYKIESVEFIQGLILGVTALAAVPYLEQYLGLPYELAWSCVIIETFLYLLHSLLGDPVVPQCGQLKPRMLKIQRFWAYILDFYINILTYPPKYVVYRLSNITLPAKYLSIPIRRRYAI